MTNPHPITVVRNGEFGKVTVPFAVECPICLKWLTYDLPYTDGFKVSDMYDLAIETAKDDYGWQYMGRKLYCPDCAQRVVSRE